MNIQSGQTAGDYLCIQVGVGEYGIRTIAVRSVLETVTIRKVPKSPAFVQGVANIMGRIVPVVNVAERFGLSGSSGSPEAVFVLVQHEYGMYGLMVDSVNPIVGLGQESIEPVNPMLYDSDAPFINAMAKVDDRLIHLLDLPAFLFSGIKMVEERRAAYSSFARKTAGHLVSSPKKLGRFLIGAVGEEEYGLEMKKLLAVIDAAGLRKMADGPSYLAGTVETTHGTVAVIDIQKKFKLDPVPYGEESVVAVVEDKQCYGLLLNKVRGIASIEQKEIKESPVVLADGASGHIRGVVMPTLERSLFMVLDETKILEKDEMRELEDMEGTILKKDAAKGRSPEKKQSYVIFQVAGIEFALATEKLFKVIEYVQPKKVPKAPSYVRGIIPVGGDLISVIDLKLRFDLELTAETADQWIIMARMKGKAMQGFIADAVTEIRQAGASEIAPPPELAGSVDTEFMEGVLMVDAGAGRTPLILDLEKVV